MTPHQLGEIMQERQDATEAAIWLQRCHENLRASRRDRATAAMLLGYLCLDRESEYGHNSNTEACTWFASARDLGNTEAESVLGTLWTMGMY